MSGSERLIEPSSEHLLFQSEVSSLAEKVLKPSMGRLSPEEYLPGLLGTLCETGLLGLLIDDSCGGCSGDALSMAIAMEEAGAVDSGLAGALAFHYLCCSALSEHREVPALQEVLRLMSSGEALGALALTEPGAGSNPGEITCSARRKGEGWFLDGNKCFVCNVETAPVTYILALARENGDHRFTCFLIPYPSQGIHPIHRYIYLGWDTIHSWAMVLAECPVPGDLVIGPHGEGLDVIRESLLWGRTALSAAALGLARSCCQSSIRYARERKQFSRPVVEHQAISFHLADMALRIETGRTTLWKMASAGTPRAPLTDMLYLFCGETAEFCASTALDIHGGLGYTVEGPTARLYRDAKGFRLALGTPDLARLRIAGSL